MAINTLENVREYNQKTFEPFFKQTKLYGQISQEYDHIIFNSFNHGILKKFTPRQILAGGCKLFSAIPFYFIEMLKEKNPKNIYDLGCGWNIFKKYYPEIIGIGEEEENFFGDIHGVVNDEFVKNHYNYFESVFSINALHFISIEDFQEKVFDFYSMIKPNGRGWLSMNLQRLIDNTKNNNFHGFKLNDYDAYIREKLIKLDLNYYAIDINFLNEVDDGIDGNIRIVIDK